MSDKPLVSFVIPIYKTESFLENCVDSVLKQSYGNIEIILVDDGSPDSCPEICDRLASEHENISAFHKPNGGLSDARNYGLRKAQGDFVCFIDSDDYWDEDDALENLVSIADREGSDIVCYGLKKARAADGSIASERLYELDGVEGMSTPELFTKMVKESKVNISACLKMINRKFLVDNNLFFKVGIKTEDLEWAIRLFALEPKISMYSHSVYVYRIGREGSITSTKDYKHLKDFCNIIDSSIKVIEAAGEEMRPALMSYLMYQTVILVALTGKVKLSSGQKKEINGFLKDVCKRYLKGNTMDRKARLAAKLYSLFGYSVMQLVLSAYLNHRGR